MERRIEFMTGLNVYAIRCFWISKNIYFSAGTSSHRTKILTKCYVFRCFSLFAFFLFLFFFQNIFLRGNIYLRVVVSAYGGNSKEFQSFFPHTLLFSFSYSSTLRAFRSHKIQVCSSLGAKYNDKSSHICFSMHTEYRWFAWCEFLSKPNWSVEIIATDRTDNIFKPRSYLRPHMM